MSLVFLVLFIISLTWSRFLLLLLIHVLMSTLINYFLKILTELIKYSNCVRRNKVMRVCDIVTGA